MKIVRTGALAVLVLAAHLAPAHLSAQEEQAADSLEVIPLVPLTVTVLRTPVRMDQAPFTVAAWRRDASERARPGQGLDEALRGVAGVQVDNRYNDALGERLSIRGFGARAQFGVRGVKVVVDGIPATMPDGQTTLNHLDLASLGRVEVIRGPASALWGNGAGGVVQLETEPPPVSGFRQELESAAGARSGGERSGRRGPARDGAASGGRPPAGARIRCGLQRLPASHQRHGGPRRRRRLPGRLLAHGERRLPGVERLRDLPRERDGA